MEAGASECPTWMNSPWVAAERRTKGASPRLRVANVSEPPGAPIEPSWGLRFFLDGCLLELRIAHSFELGDAHTHRRMGGENVPQPAFVIGEVPSQRIGDAEVRAA